MSIRKLFNNRAIASTKSFIQPRQVQARPFRVIQQRPTFQTAHYATARVRGGEPQRKIRIPPLAAVLIGSSLLCLSVGLYEYLTSDIQKFPVPIRQALRKGLYYENKKDLTLALKYLNEALELALESTELERNGAPLTGIMIQLAAVQERLGRLPDARHTLIMALRHLVGLEQTKTNEPSYDIEPILTSVQLSTFTPTEQKKAVGIAQKLGDITSSMKRDEEAERWYVWSVEHLLKTSSKPKSEYGDTHEVIFDEEHMPDWLTNTDVGAALEALGGFYANRQKPDLAIHLYLRALTLEGMKSCQSTVLMNNLAESYCALGQFEEAKIWGQRGLDLAQNPNTRKLNKDGEICDETCGVLLFNMGMLFEQTNDKSKATQFYESARDHGRKFKQIECIKEAKRALNRLDFEKERDSTK